MIVKIKQISLVLVFSEKSMAVKTKLISLILLSVEKRLRRKRFPWFPWLLENGDMVNTEQVSGRDFGSY